MTFDMSKGAKNYVTSINTKSTSGKIDFWDFYYYCALIGMKHQKICAEDYPLEEFNRNYNKAYFRARMLIAGLLIDAEMKRTGQDLTKDNITRAFSKYTTPTGETVLNAEGISLLNRYAQGGFEYLNDNASIQHDVFSLIQTCIKLINKDEGEGLS